MTRKENLHWIDEEIRTWENECQSKHPIKEALYAARKALEQEPCEDAVSRDDVVRIVQHNNPPKALEKIRKLSSVTPQEPKTGYISIDDVMSVFDDFMCGDVDEEGVETFWEMLKDKAESEVEEIRAEGENFVKPETGEWIPVTERLPDEGYSVLVMRITDEIKYMRVATYQGDCWMDDTDKFNKPNPHKVIAWMPLPEPYKAESEDKEWQSVNL